MFQDFLSPSSTSGTGMQYLLRVGVGARSRVNLTNWLFGGGGGNIHYFALKVAFWIF